MPFSPASLRRGSDCSSSSNIYSTDRRTDHVDDGSLAWIVTENQSETAAALQDLGVALKDSVACLPYTPDPEAYSLSASFDSRRRIHLPGHQLPSRSIDNNATSHKRKYQVTTMGGSPLKLRVSWSHTHSFAVDGSGDNSSPWDALAGEEPYSDNVDPLPACRPVSHSQNAASAIQSAFTPPPVRQSGTPVLQPGDEIYEVAIRPFLSQPDERLLEIHRSLCDLGLDPIGNTTRFGFKFIKPEWQPLPFQTEAWKKISRVRKLEDGEKSALPTHHQKRSSSPHPPGPLKRQRGMDSLRQVSQEQVSQEQVSQEHEMSDQG